jgi:hypothetical protein
VRTSYILRRTDVEGEWFSLTDQQFLSVLRPTTYSFVPIRNDGSLGVQIGTTIVKFYWDDPGIVVDFEGTMPLDDRRKVAAEFLFNVLAETGETGEVVEL